MHHLTCTRPLLHAQAHVVIPVDCVDGEDGVPPDVGVAMLQAGSDGGHQRLQEFRLLQLTEEAQRRATDKLVGVLEILRTEKETERRREAGLIPFIYYDWPGCICMGVEGEGEGEGKGEGEW